MPQEFYPDTNKGQMNSDTGALCFAETEFWDGPGFCTRPKGHKVDIMSEMPSTRRGEFHQEAHEGWVWDNNGSIS